MNRKFLILQFRPEDDAAEGEYEVMLRFGGIQADEVSSLTVFSGGRGCC